jgi:citrate synthase
LIKLINMKNETDRSDSAPYLSAREAAAELGVSAATLYAYVSRGFIRSEPVPGERAKRYRAEDVRALRERRAPPSEGGTSIRGPRALAFNAPVLASGISLISEGALFYRGVEAAELARHATLETAAGLLWQTAEYDAFAQDNLPRIAAAVRAVIDSTKDCHPIDRAMAALALAGQGDDGAFNKTDHGLAMTAARIVRLLAALVGGAEISAKPIHEQLAEVWSLDVRGKDLVRRALVLLADHELNASTFTLRCAVSTGANLYEGMVAALAALKGPLHGGATTRAARQLDKLLDGHALDQVREQAETGERFAGFGHALYRDTDPRAKALLDAIETRLGERFLTRELPEQVYKAAGVHPNVDYALAVLVHALDLPRLTGIGLFAVGRSVGWAAHAREQMRERMLIRPRAIYTGPAPRAASPGSNTRSTSSRSSGPR